MIVQMPGRDGAGQVLDLRADPEPGQRLGAEQAEAQQRLEREEAGGQHAVGALAALAAAHRRLAACARAPCPGRRPMNSPPVSVGSLRAMTEPS